MSQAPDPVMNTRLSEQELTMLRPYGTVRHHKTGDVLFDEGDMRPDCCVLLNGQLNVYIFEHGEERRVGWLEPGQFTGDVSLITGHASLATARMEIEGDVLHVDYDNFHRMLVDNTTLSDIFVNTLVARRAWARAAGRASVLLIGAAYDHDTFAVRDLLTKHAVPHVWVNLDTDENADVVLEKQGLTRDDAPVLIRGSRSIMRRPTVLEVSAALGLDLLPDGARADVVIVGAGPAGLAASVYAASEGLEVVTLDSRAPGGQAGTSSKIENYLGFPSGISGRELAERAMVQAQKFGARLASPVSAGKLEADGPDYVVTLKDGRRLHTNSVVLACGADYRRLPIDNLADYEGSGIYYGATAMEAQLCGGSKVAIVGAGNSAGQGAVFLSKTAEEVHVLFRRGDLRETMSDYLVRRLEETPNIHLHPRTEVCGLDGDGRRLKQISIMTTEEPGGVAKTSALETPFLFLFIGAKPCTDWLPETLARDKSGFLKTGPDISNLELVRARWTLDRMPSLYETSWPRIYAVGDVRNGSVKRVASGVGEGSVVVQYVHRTLREAAETDQAAPGACDGAPRGSE